MLVPNLLQKDSRVVKQKIMSFHWLTNKVEKESGHTKSPEHTETWLPSPSRKCQWSPRSGWNDLNYLHTSEQQRSWILPRATVSKAFCTSWSLAPCLDRDQPPSMAPGLGASPEKVPVPQHWCPWVAAAITEWGICTSHSCTANNKLYKTTVLVMRLANWEKHTHSKPSIWLTVLL